MKLYYSRGACSLAVRIIINEIGLACEYEAVDLKTKKTEKNEDYLKINPKGSVPTIITDHNEILTENAVIQQYLADQHNAHQLLPPVGHFDRYPVLEWLNYASTDLHKGFSPLFNSLVPQEIKEEIFIPLLQKKLTYVDHHLKNNNYLLGKNFTLPDAYLCAMLPWLKKVNIDINQWSELPRYFDALKKRNAVQRSFEEENINLN